jgi:hypothetical protein
LETRFGTFWQRGSGLFDNVVRGFLATWFGAFWQRGSGIFDNQVRGVLATRFGEFWQPGSGLFDNEVRGLLATQSARINVTCVTNTSPTTKTKQNSPANTTKQLD